MLTNIVFHRREAFFHEQPDHDRVDRARKCFLRMKWVSKVELLSMAATAHYPLSSTNLCGLFVNSFKVKLRCGSSIEASCRFAGPWVRNLVFVKATTWFERHFQKYDADYFANADLGMMWVSVGATNLCWAWISHLWLHERCFHWASSLGICLSPLWPGLKHRLCLLHLLRETHSEVRFFTSLYNFVSYIILVRYFWQYSYSMRIFGE